MADAVVTFLIKKLSEFLAEEQNLLCGIRGDAQFIKDALQHSTSFLKAAEAILEERHDDDSLKVWVKQVRDVSFDMEDVLDNFNLYIAHHHGHGLCGSVNKTRHFIFSLKARHQIASAMRDIKNRVRGIAEARNNFTVPGSIPTNSSGSIHLAALHDALLQEDANLVGIKEKKGALVRWHVGRKLNGKVVSDGKGTGISSSPLE